MRPRPINTGNGIPVHAPEDANHPLWVERIAKLKPDYLFSFYYRNLLSEALLGTASKGAFNLHGSLLPKYRGRAPANWVLVNGEPAVMGMPVAPDAQVAVLPQARHQQAGQVTILLHKPVGYVSGQPEDGHEAAATLIGAPSQWRGDAKHPADGRRFAPEHTRGLAPAGRLDIDSTGLLVLTQDGRVARTLIGESSGVEKRV